MAGDVVDPLAADIDDAAVAQRFEMLLARFAASPAPPVVLIGITSLAGTLSCPIRSFAEATCRRRPAAMTDSLGFRQKFAVIAPSTNTSVQPEFDAMRPRGVTNHFGRIHIPNDPDPQRRRFQRADGQHPQGDDARGRRRDDLRARLPDHGHVVGDVLGRARRQQAAAANGWRRAPASRSPWARTPRRPRSSATAPAASR